MYPIEAEALSFLQYVKSFEGLLLCLPYLVWRLSCTRGSELNFPLWWSVPADLSCDNLHCTAIAVSWLDSSSHQTKSTDWGQNVCCILMDVELPIFQIICYHLSCLDSAQLPLLSFSWYQVPWLLLWIPLDLCLTLRSWFPGLGDWVESFASTCLTSSFASSNASSLASYPVALKPRVSNRYVIWREFILNVCTYFCVAVLNETLKIRNKTLKNCSYLETLLQRRAGSWYSE